MEKGELNVEENWSSKFIEKLITDRRKLKEIYKLKLKTHELDFLTSALNSLSSTINTVDKLIVNLLEIEFSITKDKLESEGGKADEEAKKSIMNTVLRRNTLTMKILERFFQNNGRDYFSRILSEPLELVMLQSEKALRRLEVDDKVLTDREIRRIEGRDDPVAMPQSSKNKRKSIFGIAPLKTGNGPNKNQKKADRQKIKENMKTRSIQNSQNLLKFIKIFVEYIFSKESEEIIPYELRVISKNIFEFCKENDVDPMPRIGSLLFLRGINPTILFPERLGLIDPEEMTELHRRCLMLISKILQTVSNRVKSQEEYMRVFDEVFVEIQEKSNEFIQNIIAGLKKQSVEERKKKKDQEFSLSPNLFKEVSLVLFYFLSSLGVDLSMHRLQYTNNKTYAYGKIFFSMYIDMENFDEEQTNSYLLESISKDCALRQYGYYREFSKYEVTDVYQTNYSYKNREIDELSFEIGDLILAHKNDVGGDGWHLGTKLDVDTNVRRLGLFPITYVKKVEVKYTPIKELQEKIFQTSKEFTKKFAERCDNQKAKRMFGKVEMKEISELLCGCSVDMHYFYDFDQKKMFICFTIDEYSDFVSQKFLHSLRSKVVKNKETPNWDCKAQMEKLITNFTTGKQFGKKQIWGMLKQIERNFKTKKEPKKIVFSGEFAKSVKDELSSLSKNIEKKKKERLVNKRIKKAMIGKTKGKPTVKELFQSRSQNKYNDLSVLNARAKKIILANEGSPSL